MQLTTWTRRAAGLTAVIGLVLSGGALLSPASADGGGSKGTRSLAAVLAADGSDFDKNPFDYDILDNAIGAVLAADDESPVAVLADGNVALTAFLPNDRAFRLLAKDLLGRKPRSEQKVFADLAAALGVETIEQVLLYHVVPGATIDYRTALESDGATLNTALNPTGPPTITVDVKRFLWWRYVTLVDADPDDRNPIVVHPNINKGNKQIAHGIHRVLRPANL
jgi:hypothetical protein